jgi:formate dehydrogenase gamma subunit
MVVAAFTYNGGQLKLREDQGHPTLLPRTVSATDQARRSAILCGLLLGVWTLTSAAAQAQSTPLKQDENCLACHGQAGMTSSTGTSIFVDAVKHGASVHGILSCNDCHATIKDYPHPAKVTKVQCATCHADEAAAIPNSIHAALGNRACQACHGNAHEVIAATDLAPRKCAECHADEVKAFRESIHGQAAAKSDPYAPKCVSCHGPVHQIQTAGDTSSPVAKKNLPDTCASCHSNKDFLSRHDIPFAHPVEQYRQSVHGRILASTKELGASCSDCHGSHGIFPARDARSKINHWNIPATCGQCHGKVAKTYLESVHGQAVKAGASDAPVCTDCHGEHLILGPGELGSTVNAAQVSTMTCGRCHSEERLAVRYNLPRDVVPSYADSYHGLAMRGGSQTVANCASCHGVHNIFPPNDPRSTVNQANLPTTCGRCHAGAGEHFVIGAVHVRTETGAASPVVKSIRMIYWVLIPATLGFMLLHNLLDFGSKLIRRRGGRQNGPQVVRMDQYFLLVHWGLIVSFTTLVITGFALKFPDAVWARPLLLWEGHFAFRGSLHRAAAVVLVVTMAFHILRLAIKPRERAFVKAMLPKWKDVTDLVGVFRYNLGLSPAGPQFRRFNYAEKLEYWALLWGTLLMMISGFLLWFNNFTLRYFPKWVSDAATAVHYYEAVLATLSILLWHFYIVIFDPNVYPMETSWLTGKVDADHYRHTRPEYFRELEEEARNTAAEPATPKEPDATPPKDDPPAGS